MSIPGNISIYGLHREQKFYIGLFLIPVTSLTVLSAIQRPYTKAHAEACKSLYSNQVDMRTIKPLECIVPLDSKDSVNKWLQEQDSEGFHKLMPADLLVLSVPDVKFPIVKGQHRYEAYNLCLKEEGILPKDAPHPECLGIRLFHSGACICSATLADADKYEQILRTPNIICFMLWELTIMSL